MGGRQIANHSLRRPAASGHDHGSRFDAVQFAVAAVSDDNEGRRGRIAFMLHPYSGTRQSDSGRLPTRAIKRLKIICSAADRL